MYSRILSSSLIILLILTSGCQNNLSKYGEDFSELMKEDSGIFRGLNIGDSKDQVIQAEGNQPSEGTEDSYVYKGLLGETGNYTLRYSFENNQIYEILVDANFGDTEAGSKMLRGFRDFFNKKYGDAKEENGFLVWRTPDGPINKDVSIEMTDENDFSEMKGWSLSIYHQTPQVGPIVNEPAL